jgi:probable HAF family extracellular repeat protein
MILQDVVHARSLGRVLTVLFLLWFGASFSKAGTFTSIDVPGAAFTGANGINDAGLIVGGFEDHTGRDHGFLKSGSSFTSIDVPGADFTEASGINDAGLIVGDFRDSRGHHGFVATPVPEPSSLALSSAGALALFGYLGSRRRRTPRGDVDSDLIGRR